jgi:hypothetical protein
MAAAVVVWGIIILGTVRAVQYLRSMGRPRIRVIAGGALTALAMILGGWIVYGILLLLRVNQPGRPGVDPASRSRRTFVSFLLFAGSFRTAGQTPSQPQATKTERPARVVSWAVAGLLFWLATLGLSEELAGEVANYPQPDQALWVRVMTWLPVVPILLAAALVGVAVLHRATRGRLVARFAKVLFWSSLGLTLLIIPKPP